MKRIRLPHRIMAMVLVVLMTVQLLPLGAFAVFGDLQSWDAGVDLGTLKLDDAINWPIKIYDYLSDGMLFEWMDTNTSTSSTSPVITMDWRSEDGVGEYGGGKATPVTEEGLDFTSNATWTGASPATTNTDYTGKTHMSTVSHDYTLKRVAAVAYSSPQYMRISGDGSNTGKVCLTNFKRYKTENRSTMDYVAGNRVRYAVIVYKSSGVADDTNAALRIESQYKSGSYPNLILDVDFQNSSNWMYQIVDLKTATQRSDSGWTQSQWSTYGTKVTACYLEMPSLKSTDYLDISHIGFFSSETEAKNYGAACLAFDKEPGEHLLQAASTTMNRYNVTPAARSDYLTNIFTLNYCWKNKDTTPKIFDAESNALNVRYGLDFTTHSTANGWKTNAYTSDTFWTWSNGTSLTLKNTTDNITRTESFNMSTINVEQKTQSNGAQYVTLTTNGPSKILLSKFREDHQTVQEGYVPLTADVDYMVLVYRPNNMSASDRIGLWAQGYWNDSSTDGNKTASFWKYAGLTKTADWTTVGSINQVTIAKESGWQYKLIPIRETIGAGDKNIYEFDRLANLGLYLPTLTDGKSLDIAYVGYFKNNPNASDGNQKAVAEEFGENAVRYMNSSPTITADAKNGQTVTYAATRKWYGGGNKSFGMLYSSGGGQYLPGDNGGGSSVTTTEDYNYGYKFDTWMIGYRTNALAGNSFNTPRKDPITGQKYTANYTSTGTSTGHTNSTFQSNATGTTNNIFFLAATEEDANWGSNDGDSTNGKDFNTSKVPFDGYQLLETITSGVMTAGLLEGGLQTVTVNGVNYRVPVYRQETVEYIAYNLLYGLRVPMKDVYGNYNTRYIKGTPSTKFGGVDLNGDGVIGMIDYDGDGRNGAELNENSVDLATALRHELGLSPRLTNSVNVVTTANGGVDASQAEIYKKMGSYSETMAKSRMLFGEFSDCRNAIDTAMDAAYYLLNNIFIANSYNQAQNDYDYLTLSSAQVNALGHSGYAYVFDAGFTTGKTATSGTTFTDDGSNKSALVYSPYSAANGTGTISMEGVTGKTRFDYGVSTTSWTTRFPFLPVTDAEGDFAGQTQSYYFLDDAQRVYTEGSNTYKNNNFNYVIASNGEFVYREEDDLFFEFEGDDDVYLFINGQLVLDIGGAHSITSVYIDVNDYVNAAAKALEPLAQYGYHKDMPIEQFDAWISAANIQKLDADFNPTGETVANTYNADQIAEFKRQHRLNLSDGQICQFDFYYMERHGWGANMRIVTNMHITDPSLTVDKSAYQYGEEIEYGGVIDPTASVEYNFKLTNTGNTKLYNISWRDDVLGLTMDPTDGLKVLSNMNGIYVMNASGGYLQPKDLKAIVTGTDINGNYGEFVVTFEEENGDGGQGALKRFLRKLESDDGTETGYDDAEVTNAGSGLWVGASVRFCGIYYMLTPEQTDAGMVDNTVYLTATTRVDPSSVGCRTLRSDDSHRLYTNGFPIHYQWAGKNIFMNLEHLLVEAVKESDREGSQLSLYEQFFNRVTSGTLITQPCDKFGRVGGDYSDFLTKYSPSYNGKTYNGYLINYKDPGVHTFYLLMYMKGGQTEAGGTITENGTYNASDIKDGYYAILRSQVFVADVKDSVYVLDYGLSTESLDVDGLLFKDDYLFGPYGTIRTKLMGITGTEPSFINPGEKGSDPTKTGIYFTALNGNRVLTDNGFFNANLSIPTGGKEIAYDSNKGQYTLTGVGTMTVNALVPTSWDTTYLYYWYDDGTTGPSWPGTPMKSLGAGKFEIDIPADVSNVIINNGSAALKTDDLNITPGLESTITVTVHNGNHVVASIDTIMNEVTIHVKAPAGWEQVYLNHWNENGEIQVFPGDLMTEQDNNGYWIFKVKGDVTNVVVSDGSANRTRDLTIYAGKETWIDVSNEGDYTVNREDGSSITFYGANVKYTLSDGFAVHASVPAGWRDTVYLYYWRTDGSQNAEWPGEPMTKGELWYNYDKLVPADVSHIIINDGLNGHQTVDLTVTPGLETWITVNNETVATGDNAGKFTANIAYGSESSSTGLTFTPTNFLDRENNMWLAITVHSTSATPSALNNNINIHNEVQMFKKITVIPATVVYYEDTFGAVNYNKDDADSENSFTHHGNGSGQLSQSVNPDQPYGQDAAYQGGENDLYSGGSLTEVEIMDDSVVTTFKFKGTGFELIGRTTAFDAGSFMVRVYKKDNYSPTAYDDYQAKAQAYLKEIDKYLEVINGYSDASVAWQKATAKYQEALTAYNNAKAARDAAVGQTDEALNQDYLVKFNQAYTAFAAYEKARLKYENALTAYQTALQAYAAKDTAYVICTEKGSCSYTKSNDLADFDTALVLGAEPTAPVAYETLVTMVLPTKPVGPWETSAVVYTQFDHGNNGGAESINQVPVIRVNGLDLPEDDDYYVVEVAGLPTYTFDGSYEISGVQPTKLYIDGIRIFQPMGSTHEAYNDQENDASVNELRDLIATGSVGVAVVDNNGLSVSTGNTTWTESLNDNDFDAANKETYNSIKVNSTADYLIQGPNNEVYMEGNTTNSALVFYVKEKAGATVHELQIAVRALDYGRFYGAGSTGLNAQLQYGVISNGQFAWKSLVQVVSGTEQYYSIPYSECPVDTQGRYQIVLRAVNPSSQYNTLVSYTNLKLNGLSIEKVDDIGEGSIIYYQNGILVKPHYELVELAVVGDDVQQVGVHPITGNEITLTLDKPETYVYVRTTYAGEVKNYYTKVNGTTGTSATLHKQGTINGGYTFDIIGAGDVTIKIKQTSKDTLELTCCQHTYGEGTVTREPNCSITGVMAYSCTKCDYVKRDHIATNDEHHYSGGVCSYCGNQEDKYYLVGFINGKNYGCENDSQNMGEYLFVDGQLRVTFQKDSYVYVKADGNTAWYMAPSYVTTDTATLYKKDTGNYNEKMYVPGGIEVVFTLTVNDDGSLTLHYEEPCKHNWDDGQINVKATCTTDGEKIYTCSKCFQNMYELIPATGHTYVNGVCNNSGCGDIEYRTIYFKNTDGWANVYLYAWDDKDVSYTGKWPGIQMQLVDGETDIYSATIQANLNIKFNNGGSVESTGLTIPESGDMYDWSKKTWVNHSGVVDYYLVGFINGVDYGIGDTIDNMGSYKFVDGKLTVTFDKESYVCVKTTGNTAFYMTQTYCQTFAATLYNSTTGANEKMFIPAGAVIEFVLTVNADDTLDLVAHSWGSVVTKQPSCTEEGEKTFTCYLCNDSYKVPVPAVGHTFVDDVCSVCGEVDTRIVYFQNTGDWENVYIYVYTEGTPSIEFTGSWPGTLMKLKEGETDLYYFYVNATAKKVIFSNGQGMQTDNLNVPATNKDDPTADKNKYVFWSEDGWYKLDQDVEVKPQKVFLNADPWLSDGAWVAAYFFTDTNAFTWVKMSDPDGDKIYECDAPIGYTKVIFCRMDAGKTELDWSSKWNQTVNLTLPTGSSVLFTFTDPWHFEGDMGGGQWSAYVCSHSYTEEVTIQAGCETAGVKTMTCSKCGDSYTQEIAAIGHSYTEEITTAAGCETAGVKTMSCSKCGHSYTEEIKATGHDYQNGTCTKCGAEDTTRPDKVYLKPDSNWSSSGAWFVAYFFGDGKDSTWVTLADNHGNGYYECEIPTGYTGVVFVRMNPTATAPSWNDGEKWNQTVDLTVEANRLFVIENPWNESVEWKATGSWTDYDATVAECQHTYNRVGSTATCTTAGVNTYVCSSCNNSYTEEVGAIGHHYVNGTCTNCNEDEPVEAVILYLKPNSNWISDGAWFAAYFFGNGDTWVKMTAVGNGYYRCEAPEGYPSVIFCRMDAGKTTMDWNSVWNQTSDLTVPTNNKVCYTVAEGAWSKGAGSWGTYTATASYSLRSMPKTYITGDESTALNLYAINAQMNSDVVYGAPDQSLSDDDTAYVVDIKSASLVLSDDICLNYYVSVPENAENVYMTFLFNGQITTVTDYTVCEDGRYRFRFSGINAQKMGDNICATLYATVNGTQVTDCVEEYSIRTYCVNQLNKDNVSAKTVRLISDLLVYGEKAQIYMGYKTDKLVTEGLSLSPSTFTGLDESFNKKNISGVADATVRYSGVTIVLGSKVKLRLAIETDNPGDFTYKINASGVDTIYTAEDLVKAADGKYYLYFDGLKATCFDDVVTASIQRDGETIGQTVNYSVNTYILKNQNVKDDALREMLEAVYNYGCSAAAAMQK